MVITLCLSATLLAIALVDLRTRRIPDALSLPLIATGLALALGQVWSGEPGHLLTDRMIGAAIGYLVFAAIGAAFHRLRGIEGLGLGDAKLLAAAGAWLGWSPLPALILIAALGGLAQAAIQARLSRGHDGSLAFGPWLALGFAILWLAGP